MNISILEDAQIFAKPAQFSRLTDKQVKLDNLLCLHDVSFGIFLGNVEAFVNFRRMPAQTAACYKLALDFIFSGLHCHCLCDAAFLEILFSEFHFPIQFEAMPSILQEAAILAGIERLQASVGKGLSNLEWSFEGFSQVSETEDALNILFELVSASKKASCLLSFEITAYDKLRDFFSQSDAWFKQGHYAEWPFLIRLLLGEQLMSYDEINKLQVRDIIFFDRWHLKGSDQAVAWISPDRIYPVSQQANGLWQVMDSDNEIVKFKHVFENREAMVSNLHDDFSETVKQLPVHLTFELGRMQLPLQELDRVAPGYVFDLGVNQHEAVTLYANGVAVGHCEIVEVNGRLGARLIQIQR